MALALSSESMSLKELTDLSDTSLRKTGKRTGCRQSHARRWDQAGNRVLLDPARLDARNLLPTDIINGLKSSNVDFCRLDALSEARKKRCCASRVASKRCVIFRATDLGCQRAG